MGTIIKRQGRKGLSYRAQIRKHGRFLRNTSDSLSKTFSSYHEARKWITEQEALLDKGIPVPQELPPPEVVTFHGLIDRYEKEVEPYKAVNTIKCDKFQLHYWRS